jgi:hypothetical protein
MFSALSYPVILLVDFNVLGFDWYYSLPFPNYHYCSKLKSDVIHPVTFFSWLK